jgi:uncharacterized protein (DUF2336 family)
MVIIEAFLRWTETAGANDRAKAANALGRVYLDGAIQPEQRRAALMAMSHLLDDPSPKVRLALAQAVATSAEAPRVVVLALAQDQPEIACTVISQSPTLTDSDLVDLIGRGDGLTRGLIAARADLPRTVSAALVEVGDLGEVVLLLENESAVVSRACLTRIAERCGYDAVVRRLLLEREDLPPEARQRLVTEVGEALAGSDLVRTLLARPRLERLTAEATGAAVIEIVGAAGSRELPGLVEDMRATGRLTPALLIHALCCGKVDFFATAIVALSQIEQPRVRSLLATGRMHAVRAMFEAAGLRRDIAEVFVDATMLWRQAGLLGSTESICDQLLATHRMRAEPSTAVGELLDIVEKLQYAQIRSTARSHAGGFPLAA